MSGLTLTATAMAGMLLGCAAVGAVAQVAVTHAGADAAADLAALAVAARVVRGEPETAACAVGAALVADHGGGGPGSGGPRRAGPGPALVECSVRAGDALVTVTAEVRVLGVRLPVTSRARAGPLLPTP